MKKYCLLFFAVTMFFCGGGTPLKIEESHPSFLIGKWVAKRTVNPIDDTILVFNTSGKYAYSISKELDSITRDTSYWEKGSWTVKFLDLNKDKQPNSKDNIFLFTNVESASVPANINRNTFSLYNYTVSGGREFLEVFADSNIVLTTFEKTN